ncbi:MULTISPECIES: phosphoenolpyruvate--protein phosphotransferase [unclassified Wenzhouxiangella]|uniref:phosphoenolpyruvate--protein phosphotransferase n=1 Tax=unclassified Wenzhouxiangella TaxID=2613841 RepID=UPI000E32B1C9|nr:MULTISPECIES: phosphoenolpyruvate--protein phosphotransferase [unclassified Wenzhouxiangella]RFF28160.1 phosphoenolpyruvate--protein phosphotransferase [Wenzhouxiangella sp. 15181]RFP67973.1 phosphoenolpyruvate--protein phosphotransferase [Wenzhouxiangella sp. 15190]
MSLTLTGIGVTTGIALGKVHRLTPGELALPEYHLEADAVDTEIERVRRAVQRGDDFLSGVLDRVGESGGETARELLEAHRLILQDPMLIESACDRIRENRINAEWALAQQAEQLREEFRRLDDEYLALRREDLEQVVSLIQRELADQPSALFSTQVPHRLDDTVLIAAELTPADLTVLSQRRVAGLVTEHGGPWSHTAILARSLEIPMVVGVHHALDLLTEGERVVLDGHYGAVLVSPDENLERHYAEKQSTSQRHRSELKRFLSRPSRTADGKTFQLHGNAELPIEFERCMEAGVDGIGLMRTEYLFLDEHIPDEEAQYRAYRNAIRAMAGKPVTIRTLDAGGDKLPDSLSLTRGPNPALGLRGLRLSLSVTDLFRDQLRAILRASVEGPVRILLPMLTNIEEIAQARQLIAQCRETLRADGLEIDPELPVGGMIETPAAALNVEAMATELDFLSIGTNDLIQYVLAIDRQDELVSYLYEPAHPAIVELLGRIVDVGQRRNLEVTVCGELAGDERAARLLLGLGVKHFSMPPARVAPVKKSLIEASADRCRHIVERFRAHGDQRSAKLLERLRHSGGAR